MKYKLSASITEFPLHTTQETFFRKFKEADVDGVEVVINFKNVQNLPYLIRLSQTYQLPITSFHQSIWSGFGFSFDEGFIERAAANGITTFTFHPLVLTRFDSQRMQKYFTKLAQLQIKYGITICVENMDKVIFYRPLHKRQYRTMESHLMKLFSLSREYGLSMTYDISHAQYPKPQNTDIFKKVFPSIKNIHISSFHGNEDHLPLDKGDFDTKGFFTFLGRNHYKGLLTFEINYSLFKRMIATYDFSEVKRSVEIIRSLSGKLS